MKELAGLNSTKDYIALERIRDHASALLEALIIARSYVSRELDESLNTCVRVDLEIIDAAIAAARGE